MYNLIIKKLNIRSTSLFNNDWKAAKESVIKLEKFKPLVAITGHGIPMSGELLSTSLNVI